MISSSGRGRDQAVPEQGACSGLIHTQVQRLKPPCRPLTGQDRLPAAPHVGLGPFFLMVVTENCVPTAALPISGPSLHAATAPGAQLSQGSCGDSRGGGSGPPPAAAAEGGAAPQRRRFRAAGGARAPRARRQRGRGIRPGACALQRRRRWQRPEEPRGESGRQRC